MVVNITVHFSHTLDTLLHTITKTTGLKPEIKREGENASSHKPVYICEFDTTKEHDQKILAGLKRLNVTVGEVEPSPPAIKEDNNSLRHKNH